jgi:hypothetical protein
MKKCLTVLLLIISLSAFSQEKIDCSSFKKGNFNYVGDSSQVIEVERRGKYQIERNRQTGEVWKFTIRWTGDCQYEIKQFAANRKEAKKRNGHVSKVIITKTYPDRYEFTCPCPTVENVTNFSGTMIKVQ